MASPVNAESAPTPRAFRMEHERDSSVTEEVYKSLEDTYGPQVSRCEFVSLCGYLCTLLRWGWHIKTANMDGFVNLYPDYTEKIPEFEENQRQLTDPAIPAYHQWFLQQPRDRFNHSILDEPKLRALHRENHYEFLRAELNLMAIVQYKDMHTPLRQGGHTDIQRSEQNHVSSPMGDKDRSYADRTSLLRKRRLEEEDGEKEEKEEEDEEEEEQKEKERTTKSEPPLSKRMKLTESRRCEIS